MAINIPGRRISYGETFYTDWMPRGGDCAILRGEVLIKSSSTGSIYVSLETRSEEAVGGSSMDTSYPSGTPKLLDLNAVGVKTALYTATLGSNTPLRGLLEQVRCKIVFNSGSSGDYYVVRVFPLVYFDNSVVPGS